MNSAYNSFIIFKIFFPQIKLEKNNYQHLKSSYPILLKELKTQSYLSNKKWNKTLKYLTKNNLAKVNNTNYGLFVSL